MELLYFAWQVYACEPTPSHNIMFRPIFFAIGIIQIEEYDIIDGLYIWPCMYNYITCQKYNSIIVS
jgi:hypothetical protein